MRDAVHAFWAQPKDAPAAIAQPCTWNLDEPRQCNPTCEGVGSAIARPTDVSGVGSSIARHHDDSGCAVHVNVLTATGDSNGVAPTLRANILGILNGMNATLPTGAHIAPLRLSMWRGPMASWLWPKDDPCTGFGTCCNEAACKPPFALSPRLAALGIRQQLILGSIHTVRQPVSISKPLGRLLPLLASSPRGRQIRPALVPSLLPCLSPHPLVPSLLPCLPPHPLVPSLLPCLSPHPEVAVSRLTSAGCSGLRVALLPFATAQLFDARRPHRWHLCKMGGDDCGRRRRGRYTHAASLNPRTWR